MRSLLILLLSLGALLAFLAQADGVAVTKLGPDAPPASICR